MAFVSNYFLTRNMYCERKSIINSVKNDYCSWYLRGSVCAYFDILYRSLEVLFDCIQIRNRVYITIIVKILLWGSDMNLVSIVLIMLRTILMLVGSFLFFNFCVSEGPYGAAGKTHIIFLDIYGVRYCFTYTY